jgi:hypothetical protein
MADEESPALQAKRRVEKQLVEPLHADEAPSLFRGFSRRAPKIDRRVIMSADAPLRVDSQGRSFFSFHTENGLQIGKPTWQKEAEGCIYPETGRIFVKREGYERLGWSSAEVLFGKASSPVKGVCEERPVEKRS